MCLGDARLNRFIANRNVTVNFGTTFGQILPRNPLRVGLLVPASTNDVYVWFGVAPATTTQGILIDSATWEGSYFSYRTHGTMVGMEVFGRTATAALDIVLIEQLIPGEIWERLEKIDIGK